MTADTFSSRFFFSLFLSVPVDHHHHQSEQHIEKKLISNSTEWRHVSRSIYIGCISVSIELRLRTNRFIGHDFPLLIEPKYFNSFSPSLSRTKRAYWNRLEAQSSIKIFRLSSPLQAPVSQGMTRVQLRGQRREDREKRQRAVCLLVVFWATFLFFFCSN